MTDNKKNPSDDDKKHDSVIHEARLIPADLREKFSEFAKEATIRAMSRISLAEERPEGVPANAIPSRVHTLLSILALETAAWCRKNKICPSCVGSVLVMGVWNSFIGRISMNLNRNEGLEMEFVPESVPWDDATDKPAPISTMPGTTEERERREKPAKKKETAAEVATPKPRFKMPDNLGKN